MRKGKSTWDERDYFDKKIRIDVPSARKAGVKRSAKRSFNRRDRRQIKQALTSTD